MDTPHASPIARLGRVSGVAIFDALRGEVGSEKPAHDLPARPERKGIAVKGGANDGTAHTTGDQGRQSSRNHAHTTQTRD